MITSCNFNEKFWKARSVLVAGSGGLIGSALMRALRGRTARLAGWRRVDGDLRDPSAAKAMIGAGPFDVVFAMAATQGGIADHLAHPIDYARDNAAIALAVIGAAADAAVPQLVYAASGALYPDSAAEPYSEDAIASGPIDRAHFPYAAAKLLGVRLCEACAAERGLIFAPAIINNTYGPGGAFDPIRSTLIHGMIARAVQTKRAGGNRLSVWGGGRARRDVLYADDAAAALILIAQSMRSEAVNVASGVNRSIAAIAETIAAAVGLEGVDFDATKPEGALSRSVDISRLAKLGFQPSVDLETGVGLTLRAFTGEGR